MMNIEEKKSESIEAFEMLDAEMERLGSGIERLENKIYPALRDEPVENSTPGDGSNVIGPRRFRSPLAQTLDNKIQTIKSFSIKIENLNERIEL